MIFALSTLSRLLNCIPRRFLFGVADLMGWSFFLFFPFRKQLMLENLKIAFPEKSEADLLKIVRKNYQHYGKVLFEILLSASWDLETSRKKIRIRGFEHFHKLMKEGKGGVLLAAHLGNWEYSIQATSGNGIPVDVVVKEIRVSFIERFLQWYRRKNGAGILLESGTAKDILKSIAKGRFVAFILDQFMGPPIGLPVNFFGRQAGTAAALALISELRDVPILPANGFRDENGDVWLDIHPPIEWEGLSEDRNERLHQKTQTFNDVYEVFIRQNPEQWLWIHRRWKPFRGETRWPLSTPAIATALLFCLIIAGCASKPAGETGIAIPESPKIEVPHIETKVEEAVPMVTPTPQVETKKIKKVEKKKAPPKTPAKRVFSTIPADRVPFEIGERLEVDLRWTAIPAGRAVLEVREGPEFEGRPTFHLWGNALSSKIVDAIYHVDNTAESFIDKAAFMPYKFLLHMVESKQLKETRVAFDHEKGKAYYWSKRISERWGNQDVDRQDALVPQARDLWSAIYYARAIDYQIGRKEKFTVYENGQNWDVELSPIGMELVTAPAGAFHCFKIQVRVSLNNVLTPMGDTFMWLSDDSKKYLVKFDTKIKIGSLNGYLTSIREH